MAIEHYDEDLNDLLAREQRRVNDAINALRRLQSEKGDLKTAVVSALIATVKAGVHPDDVAKANTYKGNPRPLPLDD